MNVLTMGNSAKLYNLQWIEQYVKEKDGKIKILDLGCGTALNFVSLLKSYPQLNYCGIEPSKQSYIYAQQNLRGLNAILINSYAYKVYEKLKGKFDIVVSFSVLEHVYKRIDYLSFAKRYLKENGYFFINYDAGHFLSGNERLKNFIGPIFAYFGIERYYQSFVKENDFLQMIDKVGFKIIDAKYFNSSLKSIYKMIPESKKADYMKKWLEFELWMNELGIDYDDSKVRYFVTRNFILTHKECMVKK